MSGDTITQRQAAALFGVTTNGFRAWGLPYVERDGRALRYDPGLCIFARLGQRIAAERKLEAAPVEELALGFLATRETAGRPPKGEAAKFAEVAARAGYGRETALVALGYAAAMAGRDRKPAA